MDEANTEPAPDEGRDVSDDSKRARGYITALRKRRQYLDEQIRVMEGMGSDRGIGWKRGERAALDWALPIIEARASVLPEIAIIDAAKIILDRAKDVHPGRVLPSIAGALVDLVEQLEPVLAQLARATDVHNVACPECHIAYQVPIGAEIKCTCGVVFHVDSPTKLSWSKP